MDTLLCDPAGLVGLISPNAKLSVLTMHPAEDNKPLNCPPSFGKFYA